MREQPRRAPAGDDRGHHRPEGLEVHLADLRRCGAANGPRPPPGTGRGCSRGRSSGRARTGAAAASSSPARRRRSRGARRPGARPAGAGGRRGRARPGRGAGRGGAPRPGRPPRRGAHVHTEEIHGPAILFQDRIRGLRRHPPAFLLPPRRRRRRWSPRRARPPTSSPPSRSSSRRRATRRWRPTSTGRARSAAARTSSASAASAPTSWASVETIIGSTRRGFDATQANYHLETGRAVARARRDRESVLPSRLAPPACDREKEPAVDWNMLGVRVEMRLSAGGRRAEVGGSVGHTTLAPSSGYRWELIGHGDVEVFGGERTAGLRGGARALRDHRPRAGAAARRLPGLGGRRRLPLPQRTSRLRGLRGLRAPQRRASSSCRACARAVCSGSGSGSGKTNRARGP